eukprot:80397_1
MNWTTEEVAYWIQSINFEQYAFIFYSLPIDGDMLIRDMSQESLIADCGVMKIHSRRILRQIDNLRKIINEGFDEDINESIHIAPDLERPTKQIIDSLEDRIDQLEKERNEIMNELESKANDDDDDEEAGYFSVKIKELESERDELKEKTENLENNINELNSSNETKIEEISNVLNEANNTNDSLKKEMKQIKKDLRKAKRASAGSDVDDDDEEEEEEEEKKEEPVEKIEITHSKDEIEEIIKKEMDENNLFGLE